MALGSLFTGSLFLLPKTLKQSLFMTYQVNTYGFYGPFGGTYVPEVLYPNIEELQAHYRTILSSAPFKQTFQTLLEQYVGRPTPLYEAHRLSKRYNARIFLKREDLCHTGSHKINNTLGQILLAKHLGKKTNHCRNRGRLPWGRHGHHFVPCWSCPA